MSEQLNYATAKLDRQTAAIDFIPLAAGSLQAALASFLFLSVLFDNVIRHPSAERWYEIAARYWLAPGCLGSVGIAVTEFALLLISFWPGERRFEWVLQHNLRTDVTDTGNFWNYLYVISILNPAFWFIFARFLFQRPRRSFDLTNKM